MGLQDFQQLQGCLQHLDFEVWEHPNLKISTLTLKDQFFFKMVLFMLLRSKVPTLCILDNNINHLLNMKIKHEMEF